MKYLVFAAEVFGLVLALGFAIWSVFLTGNAIGDMEWLRALLYFAFGWANAFVTLVIGDMVRDDFREVF